MPRAVVVVAGRTVSTPEYGTDNKVAQIRLNNKNYYMTAGMQSRQRSASDVKWNYTF